MTDFQQFLSDLDKKLWTAADKLRGTKYAAVRDCEDPLTKALVENYRIWAAKNPKRAETASSTLFDTVAVYLAFSQKLCKRGSMSVEKGGQAPDEWRLPCRCECPTGASPRFSTGG